MRECVIIKREKNEITLVFSCPGQAEEKADQPAAGRTGKNLDILLNIIKNKYNLLNLSWKREDITITNSTIVVEFIRKTSRREATNEEVIDIKNIERLYNEVKHTNDIIICFGDNARSAIDEVISKYGDELNDFKRANVMHLSMLSMNFKIKKDMDGKKLVKGQKGNNEKRLEVIANDIQNQIN